jgi:outer membrane lipoprotein-sorting protein|tara:strand:- start:8080 stop:8706 length:627 start_codon:yes stop_codon:yes gene_type:complete
MKIKYFLFLFFTGIYSINAQVTLSTKEEKILRAKVITLADNTQSMLSDFIQEKNFSFMDNKLESKGKLVFKAPNLVKWEYTIPYHNIAIFKDDKLYVNNDGDKEVFNLKSNKLFKNLNSLIINSIKGSMFDDKQFSITYFKLDDCFLVKFIPNEKKTKRFIARFELKFSIISAQVEEIKLVEPNGDFTTIIFNNKLLNTEISDESFKY